MVKKTVKPARAKKSSATDKNTQLGQFSRDSGTRTEIQTSADTIALELLDRAEKWQPSLVVIQGDLIGRVFKLPDGKTVIGRHPTCQIQVHQRAVSSVHAEIRRSGKSLVIEDLKSTNGTVINKNKLQGPANLKPGDLIRVGATVFKYVDSALDSEFSESLHNQMTRDALTGVFNRGYATRALKSLIEIARTGYPLSMILLDLDHFKKINDTFGHPAGDYVLKETCRILVENVFRVEDVLGRYGGEEFLVLLPDCPLDVAAEVAERARKTIETHKFVFESKQIPVTTSLGVSAWKPAFAKGEDFVSFVDSLLYEAKKGGRNRAVVRA